jgi:uncharacterized protein YndB with AHSA1/START domain
MEQVKEVTLTRTLNAPRELVYKAWTEVEHLKEWWGPRMFTNPVCEVDVRPGGAILIHMQAPDGTVYPMGGVFKEVLPPEKLVFTSTALDKNGDVMFENINTVTFVAQGDKTLLTVHAKVDKVRDWNEAAPMLAGMREGWSMSLDKLETLLVKL